MEENASELSLLDFFFLNIGDILQCAWVKNSDAVMCYWGLVGFRFERQEKPGGDLRVKGITSLTALYCPLEYFLGEWPALRRVMEGWPLFGFSYWRWNSAEIGTLPNSLCVNTAPCTVMWWNLNVKNPFLVAWELYAALKTHKAEGSQLIQQD